MLRQYYKNTIQAFLDSNDDIIIAELVKNNEFALEQTQREAWYQEISLLKEGLIKKYDGSIYLEYSIPRMGRRIDALLVINHVIFVLEFKIGENEFTSSALDQVWDYALDLKNFHEPSHHVLIAPVLIATKATFHQQAFQFSALDDKLLLPIKTNAKQLSSIIAEVLQFANGAPIDISQWENGSYKPTPTIVEAAMALYNGHSVHEISRSDASAINLSDTSEDVSEIIQKAKAKSEKAICFVTGVPGAGKTLVGLNIATKHIDKENDLYSVFLSGNGPLVSILREALARDKVRYEKAKGNKRKKSEALSEVKMFIQNVHNFRDEGITDKINPPTEHVALFDEAQRAWNLQQTENFMARRKRIPNFGKSEPEFLISCMDRHQDWAVVVCLVGGGQEINTGEAGIGEWIRAINTSFPHWKVYISSKLSDSEYAAGKALENISQTKNVIVRDKLHLSVSMRSFRAENVSQFVKQVLDIDKNAAQNTLEQIHKKYPIVLTRDLPLAKQWLKKMARGTERYGIVVSSQAERLKPHAIDVKSPMDPIHWFLDGKDDVRSSYYLEDVATEFHVQGLELDWTCVTWDADLRYKKGSWDYKSFRGNKWLNINQSERKTYLKNAYRVLLTRARQGMVIVVPEGSHEDPTREKAFYDPTFDYLKGIGIPVL